MELPYDDDHSCFVFRKPEVEFPLYLISSKLEAGNYFSWRMGSSVNIVSGYGLDDLAIEV
jgi:hypothetical protein